MPESGSRAEQPRLKELVVEASRALSRLDADRLEQLVLSCQALNRDLAGDRPLAVPIRRRELLLEARAASNDMAIFARVLEATRANLKVMKRLRELRLGRLEFDGPGQSAGRSPGNSWERFRGRGWTESGYGDD
ncbi:MAG: hypothetical protein ACRD27_03140 [Terracidiphilus sp.]